MEKIKAGRKPLPPEKKKQLMAAYVTKADKELIIKHYGSLGNAVTSVLLEKIYEYEQLDRMAELFSID